ncbi:MAG: hypothetical protein KDA45_01595 [Planctomycetales bacterium]|nr:hypothetical protein [Planctomycetales bacterium]
MIEQVAGNATILADDKLRQLVVTGTLQTQATVKATLEQIDRAGNERAAEQMRSYDTQELNAASLLPTLQAMWPQMQLTADARANRIVASGTEQEQQELRLAIEQLVSAPGDGSQLVKTYPVPFGDLRTLPAVLRQLAPQALISSDVSSRTVTVWAQEPQQERVQQALEELGKTVEGALQPATYKVKPTQLAAVQSSLRSLFPNMGVAADASTGQLIVIASAATQERVAAVLELLANGSTDEEKTTKVFQFDPQRVELTDLLAALQSTIPNEVRLESNPSNNTVLAIGLPQDLDRVTELVEQLLEQLPAVEPSEIRSYDASQFNAAALLPSLQAMWPRMQLTVDSGANRIVAKGSAALQQELQTALGKLADAPQGAAQVVKTYPVPFCEMGSLPVILQRLAPQAVISSDYTSRTVTVWALESQHARVQQTLSELAKTAEQGMQPATYLVDPTQLAAAQNSLRTLFPTLSISADATTGQLIVVAAEATQQRVAAVLELLAQGPNGQEKTVKVWQLDPQRVALSDLLLALQSTIPAQVRLESNPANNSIVAIGAPAALEQVAARVEQLLQDLPAPAALTSVVYPLQNANPASAMTVLTRLLPTATFAQDPLSKTIAATARAEEHRTIAEFIESFDEPRSSGKETHVYRLQRGNGQGLAYVLGNLMPEATFYGSRQHGALVATALPEQHERIAAIVKDFDIDRENTETRVFPVGNANARSLQDAVRDLASEAAVTADSATNSLIVTATTEELERIAAVVEQVESGGSQPRTTRFYPVLGSEPLPLSRALERSFPQATLAADNASGGLFATATEDEHTAIAQVVESLNLQPTRLPTLRSFGLKHTSPEIVAGAIRDALGRRTSAGVSFNRETRSVFVVGSRDDLRVAEALVEQIDVPHSVDDSRKLRVFSLGGADGRAVTEAIENLFAEAAGQVDVRYDSFNEQLFVVGDPQQLTLVAETLEQLAPPERQLQIIQLNATDPLSFQLAAEALFEDEPYNSAPTITVDSNQQQVLIRATPSQMQAIRQLLQQMGEAGGTAGSGLGAAVGARNATGAGRLRFVPVHRNSQKLLDEIQRLWPTVRGNPLDVVRPPSREGRLPAEPQAAHGQSAPPTAVGQGSHSGSSQSPLDGGQLGAAGDVRLASTQSSEAISPETAPSDSETTREAASETTPPIVIVVGEEQWTLASADTEGLDQFQRLLDTLLSPRIAPFATSGNYSVYLLSHAGAEEVEDMLDDLFRPERSRNSSFSSTMQRVKIVSDARINALIVSGSRADRRIVEELLGVLDSEDLLDSLQQVTPTMLTLKNASAVNAERIIRDVYRSQLSSGAGRRPVSIPEGVSSEVASLLQQINAQASGPLLTVAVDETSNSLVVRAPAELTAEIRAFVHSLDQQAEDTPSRRVDLIRLQSTNTRNLEKALKILLAK